MNSLIAYRYLEQVRATHSGVLARKMPLAFLVAGVMAHVVYAIASIHFPPLVCLAYALLAFLAALGLMWSAAGAVARDDAVKARFLKAASHDLRQPIHAMELFLGTLSEVKLPSHAHQVVANARECAGQMSDMLRALADLASLDTQPCDPHWAVVPVSAILGPVRDEYATLACGKGLAFSVRDSKALIRTDPVKAERIVMNLVSNAVRHTDSGRVLVACRKRGHVLRVEVRDTGPGIAADHLDAIFQEFYRVPRARGGHAPGLGLGLAVARRMALSLGAAVAVSSRPGKGSLFSVDFPLVAGGAGKVAS